MNKIAVCFGQNIVDAHAPDYGGAEVPLLAGCKGDARDLANLAAQWGFAAEVYFSDPNIGGSPAIFPPRLPWLQRMDCTLVTWRKVHDQLHREAVPGDTYFIANSGHGTTGYGQQGMLFADGILWEGEFRKQLEAWPAGVNVIYWLDTCYSGGMAERTLKLRSKSVKVLNPSPPARDPNEVIANILLMNACLTEETAGDGNDNGAWTASGLFASEPGDVIPVAGLTWGSWFKLAQEQCTKHFEQHPHMTILGPGAHKLADTLVADPSMGQPSD